MRLLTTVMSIAAVAAFVLLVHLLCKWGVAKPRTALLLTALYALSSPTICLATHPEAITAILPIALLVLLAHRFRSVQKSRSQRRLP
jgi:hypothetical protein